MKVIIINILGIILAPISILCFLLGCIYPHLIYLGVASPFILFASLYMFHYRKEK